MGIVLLEAMASGTPVVASAIEGYTTVVHDGENGLLAIPRDAASLARALGLLLIHEALRQRLIHSGLQAVREYAWPCVARRVFDYYGELLAAQGTFFSGG
jgi:phosphatidylinositol alpha-mannosyltransferase